MNIDPARGVGKISFQSISVIIHFQGLCYIIFWRVTWFDSDPFLGVAEDLGDISSAKLDDHYFLPNFQPDPHESTLNWDRTSNSLVFQWSGFREMLRLRSPNVCLYIYILQISSTSSGTRPIFNPKYIVVKYSQMMWFIHIIGVH